MKLLKCKIKAFGKLKDFEYVFSDGLNTIKEDNGWGKSTLGVFIKAMFYGLDEGKRSIAENERIKYKPWNSTERFGGSIEFAWGEAVFRLERFFGNKKSEDAVRLFDVNTGKEYYDTENLGNRIFQIDEEGFISTVFMSQKDFEVKSNTSLTAKFNAENEIQDSALFDKAIEKLEAKAKSYRYSGGRGIIPELKAESFALDDKIRKAQRAEKEAEELKLAVKLLETETETLKASCDVLVEKIKESGKYEALRIKKASYLKLSSERKSLEEKKKSAEGKLNGKTVDDVLINNLTECVDELTRNKERENFLKEDISSMRTDKNVKKESNKSKTAIAFVILFVLAVISGAAFAVVKLGMAAIVSFVLSVAFAVTAIFAFVSKGKQKKAGENELLLKKENELAEYSAIVLKYENTVNGILSGFCVEKSNYRQAVAEIKSARDEYVSVCESIARVDREIRDLALDERLLNYEIPVSDTEELKSRLNAAQENYRRNAQRLAAAKADIRSYEAEADALYDYENKKNEISEKIKKCEYEAEITKTTLEFLREADEKLKVKYRSPLKDRLNNYLVYIDGKFSADINTDLKITIEEDAFSRETDYYSKGYRNLFEICKRFALTDVLFTAEKPFVVLDDPFCNLDDAKLSQALSLVKKLSQNYQIIYLVCHESRKA